MINSYVANLAIAKENLGRYDEALNHFKEFQNLMFDEQNAMIENKINSLEERHAMELQAQKNFQGSKSNNKFELKEL